MPTHDELKKAVLGQDVPTRWKVGLAAALFIAASMTVKLVLWHALAFLGSRSVIRSSLSGTLALALAVLLTRFALHGRRSWPASSLPVLPRLRRRNVAAACIAAMVGALLFGAVFALVYITGGVFEFQLKISASHMAALLLPVLLATIMDAAWEELTFRGWPFVVCVRAFGPHVVALLVGTVFGLAHLFNPKWTIAAIVSTALAGWLLSYTMLAFRSLLVVIGLHSGWNFAQSLLTSERFWSYSRHADPLLSGGRYGLEASLFGIGVTAVAAGVACWLFVHQSRAASQGRDPTPRAGVG